FSYTNPHVIRDLTKSNLEKSMALNKDTLYIASRTENKIHAIPLKAPQSQAYFKCSNHWKQLDSTRTSDSIAKYNYTYQDISKFADLVWAHHSIREIYLLSDSIMIAKMICNADDCNNQINQVNLRTKQIINLYTLGDFDKAFNSMAGLSAEQQKMMLIFTNRLIGGDHTLFALSGISADERTKNIIIHLLEFQPDSN
ncbi:MAG: hypothetical protein V4658_03530, partial [Bacteroidota bacterium]